MVKSTASRVLYALHQGTYVLKLIGDIRVTCCATLDVFIEGILKNPEMKAVVIDLTETTVIDSTALGLLARIAVFFRKESKPRPVIISTNPDISRILDSMGFDAVFNVIHEESAMDSPLADLPTRDCSEVEATRKVLEAHKVLMSMNERNKETFKDLVASLEDQEMNAGKAPQDLSDRQQRYN